MAKRPLKRALSFLAIAGCLIGAAPLTSWAQNSTSGLTIFSGVNRSNELPYLIDWNRVASRRTRYYLKVTGRKMDLAVSEFEVLYPKDFKGRFNPERVEVRAGDGRRGDKDATFKIQEVVWDKENPENNCGIFIGGGDDPEEYCHIEIYLDEDVPADTGVVLVFDKVKNPKRIGTHYFHLRVRTPGDVPLRSYVGTWIVDVGDRGSNS
ncbi:MAG: DUF2808 domain-containing protein [Cyanobacteria bacterium P01_F01_bin.86]